MQGSRGCACKGPAHGLLLPTVLLASWKLRTVHQPLRPDRHHNAVFNPVQQQDFF